jgi:hypothetical protein
MAVLVEAISAIVRVQAVHERYPGGWASFVSKVPNRTLCGDNELARIGFMKSEDCKEFVEYLESIGIVFRRNDQAQDIVIADQMRGFTVSCEWAEFGQIELRPGQTVSAAQLKGTANRKLSCPDGWKYEDSLSHHFGFVPTGAEQKSLRFLRHDQGLDVYLNSLTGEEVYVGRTGEASQ